jgi:hypothetical protein
VTFILAFLTIAAFGAVRTLRERRSARVVSTAEGAQA